LLEIGWLTAVPNPNPNPNPVPKDGKEGGLGNRGSKNEGGNSGGKEGGGGGVGLVTISRVFSQMVPQIETDPNPNLNPIPNKSAQFMKYLKYTATEGIRLNTLLLTTHEILSENKGTPNPNANANPNANYNLNLKSTKARTEARVRVVKEVDALMPHLSNLFSVFIPNIEKFKKGGKGEVWIDTQTDLTRERERDTKGVSPSDDITPVASKKDIEDLAFLVAGKISAVVSLRSPIALAVQVVTYIAKSVANMKSSALYSELRFSVLLDISRVLSLAAAQEEWLKGMAIPSLSPSLSPSTLTPLATVRKIEDDSGYSNTYNTELTAVIEEMLQILEDEKNKTDGKVKIKVKIMLHLGSKLRLN
jgi:hypothetical protein